MLVHRREDVVGGAVDDSGDAQHGVTGQRLGQRADHRDRAGNRRLEVQVDVGVLGGLGQLTGGLRHQRLVGGDHRLALLERGENRLARRFDRTHHFDDDVDVVAGHQCLDVVGQQFDRHAAVGGDPAHPDPREAPAARRCGRQVGGALLDDADDLAADVAQTQYRYADRLLRPIIAYLTSRLSRSSTVSRRRIRRTCPSRTATTAGRPSRL